MSSNLESDKVGLHIVGGIMIKRRIRVNETLKKGKEVI